MTTFWPRWHVKQIYISDVDQSTAEANGLRRNQKGGATVSVQKRGGWSDSFNLAKKVGGWLA